MVWLAFLISYSFAVFWYLSYDTTLMTSVPTDITIYRMVFVTTMFAALAIGWLSKHKEVIAFGFLFVANVAFGWAAWVWTDGYVSSVVAHGILHAVIAGAFLLLTRSVSGAIVGLLFALNLIWANIEWLDLLPDRPSVIFTGFYYPDLISYTSILAMVVYGLSCGDGGTRIRNWLSRPWGVYAYEFNSRFMAIFTNNRRVRGHRRPDSNDLF